LILTIGFKISFLLAWFSCKSTNNKFVGFCQISHAQNSSSSNPTKLSIVILLRKSLLYLQKVEMFAHEQG